MLGSIPVPPAVCILPMSAQNEFEGWTIPQAQTEFFLGQRDRTETDFNLLHPVYPGRYRYKTRALNVDPGALVLFQFNARIIASAVLAWIERFDQPDGEFRGAMWFEPTSIRVFAPVPLATIQSVWPEVTQFGQMMWTLNGGGYLRFARFVYGVAVPVLSCP